MKKLLLVLLCLLACNLVHAQDIIDFQVGYIDPTLTGHDNPRSPINVPTVYLDGHTLTFESNHPAYTLQLVDSNDDVVYSVFVPAGTITVILPSTYVGEFTLQLLWGDWMFYGEITLY